MKDPDSASLEVTPTWDVAVVCFVFVAVSILMERGIHLFSKMLRRWKEAPLSQALEKVKEELMFMGFISLLLSIAQPIVANMCMKRSFVEHMLPCDVPDSVSLAHVSIHVEVPVRRFLSGGGGISKCYGKGKVPFISSDGLHQIHIFLFVLAIVHLLYSCFAMLLGRAKVHWWKPWEEEVIHVQQDVSFDVLNTTFNRQRHYSFVREHAEHLWSTSTLINYVVSFFRHISFKPVNRAVYLTLRTGFLKNHHLKRNFDFHGYIMLSFENDFKAVVGISTYLWAFVVLFLLINVNGWHSYIWTAFVPLFLILLVGTKLQTILTELSIEIALSNEITTIKPRDALFWFNYPRFTLHLIHFISFQNAYELAFFFWIWISLGPDSCYLENHICIIVRLIVGLYIQFLCGYTTLPLYALVVQMGSNYNKTIFLKHIKGRRDKSIYVEQKRLSQEMPESHNGKEEIHAPSSSLQG